ncbi:MAG TPA: Shedu anti-phage system protein SduA domain-containing protein [Nitrospiraceae bacterium]|nr:Shedu anti-phage system protein SduA domain-containing protein [Nitrospiraceae bacterium]
MAKTQQDQATAALDRVAGHRVRTRHASQAERDQFRLVLNDASSEGPLQTFLATHPCLLIRMLPPGTNILLYDRPKLGSEYIPDFLISVTNSQGPLWTSIELESPTAPALTNSGEMAAKLARAVGQINDWRDWLRDNVAYARATIGLKGISNEITAWIVIGRRRPMNNRQQRRYAALNRMGFTVLSYDRLLDT